MRHEAEMKAILKQVELWPEEERLLLASQLLPLSPTHRSPIPTRSITVDDLVGIGNRQRKKITDEEIDQLRFEALKEKYGT